MILTVTLNPSVDTSYTLDNLSLGNVNRVEKVIKTPGGKGLNVSKVLNKLGSEIMATGFLGGKSGEFIKDKLSTLKILSNFSQVSGDTRTCIAIISKTEITEILEKGPLISGDEWSNFKKDFQKLLIGKSCVALSGSLPQGLSQNSYTELMQISSEMGVKVFLDTSGKTLQTALEAKPFFIKPNQDEIEDLFGIKILSEEDLIYHGKLLLKKGIENILITLGGKGAIFFNKDGIYRCLIPKVEIKNTVGSGDSTVAGFIHGFEHGASIEDTLRLSLACGTSNAMLDITGDIDLKMVEKLKLEIKIEKIG